MRPKVQRATALLLGPRRDALSGVSTHLSLLLGSRLAEEFALIHFEVGSEGRNEGALGRVVRLIVSPFRLAAAVLAQRAVIVHLNTALTLRAYWRDLAYAIVARLCGATVLYQVHGGALPQAFCRGHRAGKRSVAARRVHRRCPRQNACGSAPPWTWYSTVAPQSLATMAYARSRQ